MDSSNPNGLRSPAEAVRPTLITYLVLVALVLVPVVVLLTPYLVSLASGLILAVLCQPVYARFRRRLSPVLSGLFATLGATLLVLAPVSLVVAGGVRQAASLLVRFKDTEAPTARELVDRIQHWVPWTDRMGTPEELTAMLTTWMKTGADAASGVVFTMLQAFPSMVLQTVLVVLSTYFFLVDGRVLFRWIAGKVPLSRHIMQTLIGSFRSATSAVVLASVAAAGAQALCVLVAFTVLGAPAAFLAASSAFVLAWIPTIGTVPIWGAAAIWLFAQGSPARGVGMIVAGLAIGLVDNIVRPLVLHGRKEMHPMVSLLSIIGGLAAFGVSGAFIGPLMASLAISVLDIWPAVASHCGIAVSGSGDQVPDVPL